MIIGIGIDSVEIKRFNNWHTYSNQKLSRIFSPQEIEYCLQTPCKSSERFAVRFAAREAFYKALTYAQPHHSIPFLTVCKNIAITKKQSCPFLVVDWDKLHRQDKNLQPQTLKIFLSLTHAQTIATAYVILEKT